MSYRRGAARTYWVETLGCPKNDVDSHKLAGTLEADGMRRAESATEADIVVVNTCAFIEEARKESIERVLALADAKRDGAELVVTGCMAERYGDELAQALPEVDRVAGFGVPVTLSTKTTVPKLDLLNLPRPRSAAPWAYVKIAEGCDRSCGFCAIPTFRGKQRSRSPQAILHEVDELGDGVKEIVLVAQDLASYGKDDPSLGAGSIVPLIESVAARVARTRLLYLYPSDLSDALIDVIGSATNVPYFDLSLQHVSKPLLRRMRRWGDGDRFRARIDDIRDRYPDAAFRSNFIVGYPGETEADHDQLLDFVARAQLDWVGFFAYSEEEGTYAAQLDATTKVAPKLMHERLRELTELQDEITAKRRQQLVGLRTTVLVDRPGIARSHREAPEIDGIITVPDTFAAGAFHDVTITATSGVDLEAA